MSSGAFLGLKDSGIFCNLPLNLTPFVYEELQDPDYVCPVEEFPFEYKNWDNKWYSPLCRPWYKNQRENQKQNTMSDLYTFANAERLGITPCAPIFNEDSVKKDGDSSDFYGALCIDINPGGPLKNYFPEDQVNE